MKAIEQYFPVALFIILLYKLSSSVFFICWCLNFDFNFASF